MLHGVDHAFRETVSMQDSERRWPSLGEVDLQIIATLKAWIERVR